MDGVLATMGAELLQLAPFRIIRSLAGGVVAAEAFFADQKNLFPSHSYILTFQHGISYAQDAGLSIMRAGKCVGMLTRPVDPSKISCAKRKMVFPEDGEERIIQPTSPNADWTMNLGIVTKRHQFRIQ